jgi:hypothetical protein
VGKNWDKVRYYAIAYSEDLEQRGCFLGDPNEVESKVPVHEDRFWAITPVFFSQELF